MHVASRSDQTAQPVLDSVPIKEFLAGEIRKRNDALISRYAGEGEDVPDFLRSLEGEWSSTIRQPPQAAQKLLRISRRPDKGINEVIRLIDQDPALSQAILKYASSALMAGGLQAGSRHALSPGTPCSGSGPREWVSW